MQYLHFADNLNLQEGDKYAKIRPLSDKLRQRFMAHFQPTETLSLDETMVEYFGKHGCKQCIRNKPIRFGFKIWCLNSDSGYLANFELYQGKTWKGNPSLERIVGKCGGTVLHLIDGLPDNKKNLPFNLYFDNLFSSFELCAQLKLRNYFATSTIRDNRLQKCPITSVAEMKKKRRGSISSITDTANDLHVCRWLDNSVVTMLSTCHGSEPMSKVKRYSQREKDN